VPLSRTYNEIREMVETSLLQTKTARDIVRKGMVRAPETSAAAWGAHSMDPWGQYAQVDSGTNSQYGSVIDYLAQPAFEFPRDPERLHSPPFILSLDPGRITRFADWRFVDEVRALVTVTDQGVANSTLDVYIVRDTLWPQGSGANIVEVPFESARPSVPLDEVGLHITDWCPIDWPEGASYAGGVDSSGAVVGPFRPAQLHWIVNNPSESTGTAGIGLCQLQGRQAIA
jgi:hypothetical protein